MSMTTALVILVILVAVFVVVRMRQQAAEKAEAEQARPRQKKDTTYHAVSIKFDQKACQAARDMTGRRFLATAAPRLPLPDCNVLECNCRFTHHDDRRSGKDRRSPFDRGGRLATTGEFEQEQRTGKDRRKSDFGF